jgi:hypothetical protein
MTQEKISEIESFIEYVKANWYEEFNGGDRTTLRISQPMDAMLWDCLDELNRYRRKKWGFGKFISYLLDFTFSQYNNNRISMEAERMRGREYINSLSPRERMNRLKGNAPNVAVDLNEKGVKCNIYELADTDYYTAKNIGIILNIRKMPDILRLLILSIFHGSKYYEFGYQFDSDDVLKIYLEELGKYRMNSVEQSEMVLPKVLCLIDPVKENAQA